MIDRPVLRYHGGKWRLAEWILTHFPPHRVYVEPFAGAASVLMQKPRVAAECINDLDERVVNVFRVLRDPHKAERLRQVLALTPFARAEFNAAYEPPVDDVDAACKTVLIATMGHGTDSLGRGYRTGFRSRCTDNRALPSSEWATWPEQVPLYVERLKGVTIEQRDAIEVIQRLDSDRTLFYVDPPYPLSTRSSARSNHGYRHEMTDDAHRGLAKVLRAVEGMVVLSGYPCDLYDKELYSDWTRYECQAVADHAAARTEVVWLNELCLNAQRQQRLIA